MGRLRRSDCSAPGIVRRRAGRGFYYLSADGRRIKDPATLERIRALAIPPAWQDVWICPWAHGHIQATGVDARGRRQYRYHDTWRQMRDREKFDHMVLFARALPDLRRAAARALKSFHSEDGPGRDVVLAAAVRLLDLGCFRVGSESYAEENGTYGLASLERRHVRVVGDTITFDFVAKGGQRCVQEVSDTRAAGVVERLRTRRPASGRLLEAKRGRRWVAVDSNDINAFIKEVTGGEFTAKEVRTWKATVLAAVCLAQRRDAASLTARKRAVTAAVKDVADYLGDTPSVARNSYIDPRVIDLYLDGETIGPALPRKASTPDATELAGRPRIEAAVLDLLDGEGEQANAA